MPLLPGQLARQRERAERDLTDTCEIHRYGPYVVNDLGERKRTWAPVATGVKCRLVPVASVAAGAVPIGGKLVDQQGWRVVLPYDTDITTKDRVFVTVRGTLRSFEVTQVLGLHTDEIRKRVGVEEST